MIQTSITKIYHYDLFDSDAMRGLISQAERYFYIKFVDGTFDSVVFNFKGSYSRNKWKILELINKEISRLEAEWV